MDQEYLRCQILNVLSNVLDISEQSKIIQNMLLEFIEEKQFKHVACFIPLKKTKTKEIDLTGCINRLLKKGIQCYKPCIVNDEMYFVPVLSSQSFDKFDIIKKIDLIICPGLVFNEKGHRIGRGKGYYDKTLSFCKNINNCFVTIGVGFDIQNLKSTEWKLNSTDVNMDFVMFPSKVVKCT